MFYKPRNILYLKQASYLCLSIMIISIAACTPTTPEEDNANFNQRFGPEYTFNRTHLMVNWQGNAKHRVEPLKLNIPLAYLYELKPMKNNKIDTIYLKLRRSNGQPVPYVSPDKTDDPEITKQQKEIYADEYVVTIDSDLSKVDLREKKAYFNNELFRGKDQAGLEHYVEMQCYDIQELQIKALDPNYESSSKWMLKDLANKASYDITPAHCLMERNGSFWISSAEIPKYKQVRISMILTMAGYQIAMLYKGHLVIAYPRKSEDEIVKNWQRYHQQITQLLDSMVMQ